MDPNSNQFKILVCVDGPMDGAVCSMRTVKPLERLVFCGESVDGKAPARHIYIIEDGCLLRYSHSDGD